MQKLHNHWVAFSANKIFKPELETQGRASRRELD